MNRETALLNALELAHAEIASLKKQVDNLTLQCKINDTLSKVESLPTMSTHDAIKHLEQQLKDDGCEFVGC